MGDAQKRGERGASAAPPRRCCARAPFSGGSGERERESGADRYSCVRTEKPIYRAEREPMRESLFTREMIARESKQIGLEGEFSRRCVQICDFSRVFSR